MKILLVDREAELARAWRDTFEDADDVEVVEVDYFARPADAMVSPANSFGIMDGGLDLAIRNTLGFAIQGRVQRAIIERHHGELPVGCAELVETGARSTTGRPPSVRSTCCARQRPGAICSRRARS